MTVTAIPATVDDAATALATVLADELSRCGVTDAIVSPGSRSAALARALWAHPGIRVHVRIDERSAGFLAIGLARAGGRPAAVVCTSGTAAANLHPAVLEAHHDRVPLLLLTADRRAGQVGYWRSVVCRAVDAAGTGPSHLNVALRSGSGADPGPDAGPWPEQLAGRAGSAPWTAVSRPPVPAVDLAAPARGLVVAGAGADPRAAVAFAEAAGWPLLAEPHSNARYGRNALTAYVDLLAHPKIRSAPAPEAIVTCGRPGLSRELLALYGDVPNTVVDPHAVWDDPGRAATAVVPALGRPLPTGPRDPGWLTRWQALDHVAATARDALLDTTGLTEPVVARELAARIPDGGLLFVAASMPIRDLERTMRPRTGLRVLANRGLAGIDGAVSTAVGATLAHSGPGYALLGDLSFLHDQNGLPSAATSGLTLVVVNNDGGGIFSLLGHVDATDGSEELFGTPHGVGLAHVAAAAGWPHALVSGVEELARELARPGGRIVEVRSAREPNAALHRRLRANVTAALDRAL
ncbi:2-succinyl-5-enolpyruvyl-6-hydroxy-3-cyclohexene-1-carboxylate synthase [Cryptosporangium sp. NPDC051539]|uniref:2-succinyl-5-enolpyruvyl-6-hydroxy-3- cyclohexene-1-carboxylate synthase n=1 Tax=Cryptosporangium sp. NPDC051539 TaxID=3363962 RepID=UPI003789EA7A